MIHVAAVVTAWAVFQDCLARKLRQRYLSYDLSQHPSLAPLVEEDVRTWDRRFDKIEKRYQDFAGIALSQFQSWDPDRHGQEHLRATTDVPGAAQRSGPQLRPSTRVPT